MGPITIFDKSALQALSIDETVWLEAYFLSNVTPLFYVETDCHRLQARAP
jgi:hypothetical protein